MNDNYDDACRRLGAIFGDMLDQQIENERYLLSRMAGSQRSYDMLLRAKQLRLLEGDE